MCRTQLTDKRIQNKIPPGKLREGGEGGIFIAYKKKRLDRQVTGKAKETYPHFRYYKKSKHPALITAEHSETEYKYRKVMHSEKDGRHLNEKVYPNPNPKDKQPMYIGKRVRHDRKAAFEAQALPWKYPRQKKK